jgi:hypothetical protein
MVLLFVITAGIYSPCWFLLRRQGINSLNANEKLGVSPFVIAIFLYAVAIALGVTESTDPSQTGAPFARLVSLAAGVVLLVQSFKVRRIFEAHLQETMLELSEYPHLKQSESSLSGVAVFFLNIFYLQYVINNRLAAVQRVQHA